MDAVAGKATLPANARRIPIPAAALSQWLADIDDIAELKVTLRALALLAERTPAPNGSALHRPGGPAGRPGPGRGAVERS